MKLKNAIMLSISALIWGVAFVAQSAGMEHVEPFTFNAVRFFIGGLVLLPCIRLLNLNHSATDKKQPDKAHKKTTRKTTMLAGLFCGLILAVSSNLQQIGLQYTSPGKAGFITALYIVLVPILGIFLKKKTGLRVWIGVVIAVCGLYLLCITDDLRFGAGDIYVLVCAFCFSVHILVVDYFSDKVSGVKLACMQFFVCSFLSAIPMALWETPQLSSILACWLPILYTGVLSCGIAYTFQIIGQRGMNPSVASLVLSMESVVSVIAGFLILGATLSWRELLGCGLMFTAIILAQLPGRAKKEHPA